jgi:DNA-binding SARP family transcriptional activator/tetratricopeptide (TPR) repeat protein
MSVEIRLLGRFRVVLEGEPVGGDAWKRRSASSLVKLLALTPSRSLHRERVLDALWPDVPVQEAAPRLHKAAHYARRALGRDDAILLRADTVTLLPAVEPVVDVVVFERLAAAAVEDGGAQAASAALAAYNGDLLPEDLYEEWTQPGRERLRGLHLGLLRQVGRWDELVRLDPTDEQAHLALMREYARAGDRRGALRQYERLERALRQELGVAPSRNVTVFRDSLLAADRSADRPAAPDPADLVGRQRETAALEDALRRAARGQGCTVVVSGAAGAGKSVLLDRTLARAGALGWRVGRGCAARVEGAWPYAPVLEALSTLCREHPALLDGLGDEHRVEIERALSLQDLRWSPGAGHQRLFVAAAELLRLAAAGAGAVLAVDDVHDCDEASLRLLHYLARAGTGARVLVLLAHRTESVPPPLEAVRSSLLSRGAASEIALRPLDAAAVRDLVERHVRSPTEELLRQLAELADGRPFAVLELARHAGAGVSDLRPLLTVLAEQLPRPLRDLLTRVAVAGVAFDTDEFVALSGLPEEEAYDRLDEAVVTGALRREPTGYRFRHPLLRESLLEHLPEHRRRVLHRDAAVRLAALGASPARVAHHLLASGDDVGAVPHVLRAARAEAAVGAYRDALQLLEAVRGSVTGPAGGELHVLRGDLLARLGDPQAVDAYREAVRRCDGEARRHARAGLARAAVAAGDLETAAAALEGLEPDGGPSDQAVLLARGNLAYCRGDVDEAWRITQQARRMLVTAEDSWEILDLVALQGLIAHHRGEWFTRLRAELQIAEEAPRLVTAVFDANLCVAEYLLYGPTPYGEVIRLGRDIRRSAERAGALRAVAFGESLVGEAALLSGDLRLAETSLQESADLSREIGARAGEAHALQRLAEVRLACGDRAGARELLTRALPLARWSSIAMHLLQRIHGTMIVAAPDRRAARAMVDVARANTDDRDECLFCSVMFAVPAAIACADVGDVELARSYLSAAERSTALWAGTAWQAATREADAHVVAAEGHAARAVATLLEAGEVFEQAGQPLDAARCRRAAAGIDAAGIDTASAAVPGQRPVTLPTSHVPSA